MQPVSPEFSKILSALYFYDGRKTVEEMYAFFTSQVDYPLFKMTAEERAIVQTIYDDWSNLDVHSEWLCNNVSRVGSMDDLFAESCASIITKIDAALEHKLSVQHVLHYKDTGEPLAIRSTDFHGTELGVFLPGNSLPLIAWPNTTDFVRYNGNGTVRAIEEYILFKSIIRFVWIEKLFANQ